MLTLDTVDLVIRDESGEIVVSDLTLRRQLSPGRPGPWEAELPCGFCTRLDGITFVTWQDKPERFIRVYSSTGICEDCEARADL